MSLKKLTLAFLPLQTGEVEVGVGGGGGCIVFILLYLAHW